jgi:hypothetical protein
MIEEKILLFGCEAQTAGALMKPHEAGQDPVLSLPARACFGQWKRPCWVRHTADCANPFCRSFGYTLCRVAAKLAFRRIFSAPELGVGITP